MLSFSSQVRPYYRQSNRNQAPLTQRCRREYALSLQSANLRPNVHCSASHKPRCGFAEKIRVSSKDIVTTTITDVHNDCSIIVSIPIDLSSEPELQKLEGGGARGLYCAVEQVKELDNGNCEWRYISPRQLVDQHAHRSLSQNGCREHARREYP